MIPVMAATIEIGLKNMSLIPSQASFIWNTKVSLTTLVLLVIPTGIGAG